jgi:hypothetical protein
MRTLQIRSPLRAALALLVFTGSAAAAQDPSSALLNDMEVRQLVARAEPADHARLGAHFAALAEQYTAAAKRHTSMSQGFGGNPNRNLGSGMSAHCTRLAELNTQSATTVRELVTYHQTLAAGVPAAPPRDAARFHAGAGAPAPSEQEISALAAQASTPAEHRALEEYFLTLAKQYTAEADAHASFAMVYRGARVTQPGAQHDRLAGLSREAAKEATTAAAMHKELAFVPR